MSRAVVDQWSGLTESLDAGVGLGAVVSGLAGIGATVFRAAVSAVAFCS